MKRKIIVLTEWFDEKQFYQLKQEAENNFSNAEEVSFLVWVNKSKELESLPKIDGVNYLTKKDYSFFGKLKNTAIKSMLKNNSSTGLVIALEKEKPFLKRILKNTSLKTMGIESDSSLKFDLSFSETTLKGGDFFKKLDKYLTKIQL